MHLEQNSGRNKSIISNKRVTNIVNETSFPSLRLLRSSWSNICCLYMKTENISVAFNSSVIASDCELKCVVCSWRTCLVVTYRCQEGRPRDKERQGILISSTSRSVHYPIQQVEIWNRDENGFPSLKINVGSSRQVKWQTASNDILARCNKCDEQKMMYEVVNLSTW